jgi:hypothetical protein
MEMHLSFSPTYPERKKGLLFHFAWPTYHLFTKVSDKLLGYIEMRITYFENEEKRNEQNTARENIPLEKKVYAEALEFLCNYNFYTPRVQASHENCLFYFG